jgi:hypothetical protein
LLRTTIHSPDAAHDYRSRALGFSARWPVSATPTTSPRSNGNCARPRLSGWRRSSKQRIGDLVAASRVDEVSDLVDSLLGQAHSLRQEAERLQATLEEARARFGGEERREEPEQPGEYEEIEEPEEVMAPRLRAVASEQAPPEVIGRSDSAGARLLATQMAISGSSREEIAHRLRNGFEIEDADAILDAILGPESH